jgi:DNA (cytosine-5)-methyltransferase 1
MSKPRLLDLFCGAGGAGMGYHRAGFEVVGVDIKPQPHYPFEFHQADALTFPLDGFDAIHASPPCQAYSVTKHTHDKEHPELVDPTRSRLESSGVPWIMENVVGAPLRNPLVLCGASFQLVADDLDGLRLFLRRHRLFESSHLLFAPGPCGCSRMKAAGYVVGGVYGGGSSDRTHAKYVRRGGYTPRASVRRELMGMDWTTQDELSLAIPPAYSYWLGTCAGVVGLGSWLARIDARAKRIRAARDRG